METGDPDRLEKPQKKPAGGSRETAGELAEVRPELPPEEEMPHADQIQDKEPGTYSLIQRNSIFNRTVRRRSRGKARDTPERNTGHLAGQYQGQRSQRLLHIQREASALRGA